MKGFTLFELLVVLLILSMALLFTLPILQDGNEQIVLWKEQYRLHLFLRKIQARVENSANIWFLIGSSDLVKQSWCITAQIKSNVVCDCMKPQLCPDTLSANFYYPAIQHKTMLISKQYYPKEMSRLNGVRDTQSTTCFVLRSGKNRVSFSLFNVGSVKLKGNQSASACLND